MIGEFIEWLWLSVNIGQFTIFFQILGAKCDIYANQKPELNFMKL